MSVFTLHPIEYPFLIIHRAIMRYRYRSYPKEGHDGFREAISQKKLHRVLQWSQRWGLHRGSHGSLRLAHLNPTSVTTSREADRYRLEKMGMTGYGSFLTTIPFGKHI